MDAIAWRVRRTPSVIHTGHDCVKIMTKEGDQKKSSTDGSQKKLAHNLGFMCKDVMNFELVQVREFWMQVKA